MPKCRMFGCKYPAKRKFKYCAVCQDKMDAAAFRLKLEMRFADQPAYTNPGETEKTVPDRLKRRAQAMKSYKQYRDKRIAEGICPICKTTPLRKNRSTCQECSDKHNAYQRKRRKKIAKLGTCTRCGILPSRPKLKTCAPCARKRSARKHKDMERYYQRRADGLCTMCGKPSPDASRCKLCTDHANALRRKRRRKALTKKP